MLLTKNKISRELFIRKFKKILDIQIIKMFQDLYPKINEVFPKSKLYQSEQLKIEDKFLIYQTYVLESEWNQAPYEEFFRNFNNSSCIVDGIVFNLLIEDSFLKTKSKICFKFIVNYDEV